MAYDSRAIANRFIDQSMAMGVDLTPMHVLKLVYIAHGWSLALLNEPLTNHQVEAWPYGPVIPPLYHAVKKFGASAINEKIDVPMPEFRSIDLSVMERVFDEYAKMDAFELSRLTHKAGTPWYRVFREEHAGHGSGYLIPNELIRGHYAKLVERAHGAA